MEWPDPKKINALDKNKIVYGCVENNSVIKELVNIIQNKKDGVPVVPIPPCQTSIAGGFFILHKERIHPWFYMFENKLSTYFSKGYLVKDDQIILADCIFSDVDKFTLCQELTTYDNWFMFQRILNIT
jgi:hypothetical protein